jgi:hypothetical protein
MVLLALPPVYAGYAGHGNWLIIHFWVLFGFFAGLTFLMLTGMMVIQKIKPEMYAQTFLIITIVKMLASMFLALIFVSKIRIDHTVFLVDFFYLYFLNTGFEVYVLLRNLRNQN